MINIELVVDQMSYHAARIGSSSPVERSLPAHLFGTEHSEKRLRTRRPRSHTVFCGLVAVFLACSPLACAADTTGGDQSGHVSEPGSPPAEVVQVLGAFALPLQDASDLGPVILQAQDRRLVLLGEASHGTSEFYTWRAALTRRLVEEAGFRFVAVEGDWVPIYRLNRYVKGLPESGESARAVMQTFSRWPTWMWANEEMVGLIEWLRDFNRGRPRHERVGFYGIDVYGEEDARRKVLTLLEAMDPELGREVAERYACLDRYGDDLTEYARGIARGRDSCETAVAEVVDLLQAHRADLESDDPALFFHLEQTARVVRGAERHYRAMPVPGPESWNFRVDHFFETVDRLRAYFGPGSKGIVWAHNTHIGDARATAMAAQGQRNIGQLAREGYGPEAVFALGFGTHRGQVMAAREWGLAGQIMEVPPAAEGSFEDLLHRTGKPSVLLLLEDLRRPGPLMQPRAHRAIGVVFRPERERIRNYVETLIPERYDAFIYLETTGPVRPLGPGSR
jgi:erythromycin esterase